jgi:hypothetical protein
MAHVLGPYVTEMGRVARLRALTRIYGILLQQLGRRMRRGLLW